MSAHLRVCPYMTRLAVIVAVHGETAIMTTGEFIVRSSPSSGLGLCYSRLCCSVSHVECLFSRAYLLISRDALRNLSNPVQATLSRIIPSEASIRQKLRRIHEPSPMIPMHITLYQSPRRAMPVFPVVSRGLFALPSPATIQIDPYLSGSAYKGALIEQVPFFAHD